MHRRIAFDFEQGRTYVAYLEIRAKNAFAEESVINQVFGLNFSRTHAPRF